MAIDDFDIIGLVPMAGRATRLGHLPGSKELVPLGFRALPDGTFQPKVVSHYLLETFRNADIHKVVMVLRQGKWDIPAYYRDGGAFGLDIAYTLAKLPWGVPYTLDSAYSVCQERARRPWVSRHRLRTPGGVSALARTA